MEGRKMVSRILELQGSAAKASSLESHNEEYVRRVTGLEDEVKKLRNQLKQVEVQKNTFERDVAVYIAENKNLKQEMKMLKEAWKDDESSSTRLLREIKEKNENLAALKEAEFQLQLKDLKEKMKSDVDAWAEKYRNLEKKQAGVLGEKREIERKIESMKTESNASKSRLQVAASSVEMTKQKLVKKSAEVEELNKTIKELQEKLSSSDKSSAVGSMKAKIQIQAMETKMQKVEDEKNRMSESHKEELKRLQNQLEEREKQLGAQSNINKRMQSDWKSELQSTKQELQAEIARNKELSNQIMRLELKFKSANENQKSTEEEGKVKIKCYEEQISVLQKDATSKAAKLEELKRQLLEAHDENGSELQDLSNQIVILKKEKRTANNRVMELTEQLEATKESLGKEMEKLKLSLKEEVEKLKTDNKEKEKRSVAQSCVSRKVQEDMKRQMENGKRELESEKLKSNELNKELKRLELRLKSVQDSVKVAEDDKTLKLKLSEEQVTALQKEIVIKNNKFQDLQRQLLEAQEMNGKDMEELTEKLGNANREKRAAQTKITELLEEINKAERLKSRAELSSRSVHDKHETATKELETVSKKSAALEKKLQEVKRSRKEEIESVRIELEDVKRENEDLKTEMKSAERMKSRAELDNRSNHQKQESLQKELQQSTRQCVVLERKLQEAEKQKFETTRHLEKELEDARKEVEELKVQIKDTKAQKSKVELNSSDKEVTMKRELRGMTEKCQRLEQKLQETKTAKDEDTKSIGDDLEDARQEIEELKEEKAAIEEKFEILRESCSVIETLEDQLDDYHNKCQELQTQNSSLIEKLAVATREKGGANRKAEKYESESQENNEKIEQLENALEALKQTCVMMEEQVDDLEKFNNQLLQNQEEINAEKEKTMKQFWETKKKLDEVEHSVAQEKRRGLEIEDDKQEEILQLQVKAREEANQAQELQDTVSDMERKYKLLEMHASALQKKLNAEKEASERLRYDIDNTRSRQDALENKRQRANDGLRAEIERADALAQEKTALQNDLDTIKMKQSHENIKLNCTIAQQSKLIDFLQAKVETLEPQDKKKKKQKKNDLYQVPLQYRELQDMLEESKQTNIQLQQKVNDLRTELQNTKSDVSRLKHGINGSSSSHALSPGSIAAISAIVRSPNVPTPSQTPNARSKFRMHHNIPHRLVENLCTHATKCHVCLDTLRFGRVTLRCSDCHASCHVKCRNNMTSACGLPGGLVQHYKQGGKASTASPVSCISVGGEDGDAQGWLKVLCGGSLWEKKWVQLRDGVMIITNSEKQANSKRAKTDLKDREVVDLIQQNGYVHATVPASELDNTAKTDVPYVFKLELGPETSCWPPRNIHFLAGGFTDKQKWVAAMESITTRNSSSQDPMTDPKILGNKIVTMQVNEKLEMNCSLPVSKEKVLFGCDEGLYLLPPSTQSICDRSHMVKVTGTLQILQMEFLKSPNLIIAIEGPKRRVVTFDVANLIDAAVFSSDMSVKLTLVDDVTDCHLFATGSIEGSPHLCSASAAHIQIHRFNSQLGKFVKRKEIATSEPCTCLQFTMCSIIMGTNKFYEIELKSYKVDEFLDTTDRTLIFDGDSFPIAVLQIGQRNGKHEYLLCHHEFGVFVDGFGKRTRKDDMNWSRLPLSFAYKHPYLIVTHFYSVEIIRISSAFNYNDNPATQQSYISIPSPRYLGPAITEGAVYLSSDNSGKVTVYCCKGNMEEPERPRRNEENDFTPKSCLKRRRMQLAASSQESLDEDIAMRKRSQREISTTDSESTVLSDTTNISPSSESMQSCNTSRWTVGSKLPRFPTESTTPNVPRQFRRGLHASCDSIDSIGSIGSLSGEALYAKYSEDDTTSTQSGVSSRVLWRPLTNSNGKQPPEKPVRKTKTPGRLNFEPMEI